MSAENIIEPSSSEWASPVVLVLKSDGQMQFCVDYRRLNALTIRDSYPLTRMDDCLDSLGEAQVYTKLDCNSGYWQIPIRDEDKDKTSFKSHVGTYRFKSMPFGLTSAPATFQRAVEIFLSGYKWQLCLVYLDDIIIFSKSPEDHVRHVDKILGVLGYAGVMLKILMCLFFQPTVNYLCHTVRLGKLEVLMKSLDALKLMLPGQPYKTTKFFGAMQCLSAVCQRFCRKGLYANTAPEERKML